MAFLPTSWAASAAEIPRREVAKEQARALPNWVREAVIYEVFPRAFSARGDLNGVTARLDELKTLGVTVVWLMPVHDIGVQGRKGSLGSPYAVRDHDTLAAELGSPEDLQRLVREAHARGLRVILDVVLNHTSWDSVLMREPSFYTRDAEGRIVSPVPDWADVADLNYDEPRLRRYLLDLLARWLKRYDLDGFRCDVAFMVPTDFWEQARVELERVKPELLLLAEAAEPELLVRAFDLDYAWPLHARLTEVLQGQAPVSALRTVWEQEQARYPRGALHMLFSDNHDERRALTRFGERGALLASALVFTLEGVPLIYNGMEVGDSTESCAPALFERLPIFWPIAERRPRFRAFYEALTALRRAHPALTHGALHWLRNSDEGRLLTFVRRGTDEELVVALNFSSQTVSGTLEVSNASAFHELTPPAVAGALSGPSKDATTVPVGTRAALPALTLEAWGVRVFGRALP
jgi:glycosidase